MAATVCADVRAGVRSLEKSHLDKSLEERVTRDRFQSPQPLDLPCCQMQTRHLEILRANQLSPIRKGGLGGNHRRFGGGERSGGGNRDLVGHRVPRKKSRVSKDDLRGTQQSPYQGAELGWWVWLRFLHPVKDADFFAAP
jgi:hypothetical protein